MKETNRYKLYSYCKQYIRTIDTRQDIILLDPEADLTVMDKINSKLKGLEKNIKTVVNDDGDDRMTEKEQYTLKEIDNFNYGIQVTDIILDKDNGIELPQSTVCDLLNNKDERIKELEQSIQKISEKTKEFKEHIESELQFADKHLSENYELWSIHKNCYEQVLEEMPMLLLWEGDVE